MSKTDCINMRLHDVERAFYDRKADFLVAVALDEVAAAKTEDRLMRDAEAIYRRARAFAPRPGTGTVSVRAVVVDVLRRLGGAA